MSPLRAHRRRAAAAPGHRDRRQRRRRAAGHQREPDLPVLAPLPLPRRHRRDRATPPASTAAPRFEDVYSAAAARQGRLPRRRLRGLRRPARPRPDRRVLPHRAARRPAHGRQPRRPAPRRAAQQGRRLTGVPPLRRFFNHPTDVALARHHRGPRHPDRRRQHGRDRRREQQGLHALRAAHAAHPAPAPGPPPRDRPPARPAARRRGPLRRRRRERRRPDRHPPRRRPGNRVRPAVLRPARLGLRARGEDPQGRPEPAPEPLPVPARRRRATPRRPPGSRWRSTRR